MLTIKFSGKIFGKLGSVFYPPPWMGVPHYISWMSNNNVVYLWGMETQDKIDIIFSKYMDIILGEISFTGGKHINIYCEKKRGMIGYINFVDYYNGTILHMSHTLCDKIYQTFGEKQGPNLALRFFQRKFPNFKIDRLIYD